MEPQKKWKAERIIDDVEHYGRKLKAESHIADFNLSLKPQSNQSNGNLGLLLGSMFCFLLFGFIGFTVLSNHEQKTSNPISPSLDSLPIAP
ncbi:membrane protein [Aphanothece sacrum FPU3]|nr:membrane protein [Aphanothece sacrum FPU3]